MLTFTERLSKPGILVADGATGTMLQMAGLPVGAPSELWVLENPEGILNLHRMYRDAGSDVVLTDTFGGTRIKLNKNGLGDRVTDINRTAAKLAREIMGDKFVLGDIGPTGELLEPLGPLSFSDAVKAFAEQARALAEGGADAIIVETLSDLNEARAAIEGVKQATTLPVIITMSFDTRGRTMMGVKPAVMAKELLPLGVTAIGANCGRSLSENLQAIQEMRDAAPNALLVAKPNAGLPHIDGSNTVYDVSPEVVAEYALKFAALGVKILGTCCGSNPDHIRAIAKTLKDLGLN